MDWKTIISFAVLIYALAFGFKVYTDHKIDLASIKLKALEIMTERDVLEAKDITIYESDFRKDLFNNLLEGIY